MVESAIRRLLASDDTSQFRCGDPEYDLFLQRYAVQNQDRLFVGTRLAVAEAVQGRGLGRGLAARAFTVALQVRAGPVAWVWWSTHCQAG